MNELGIRRELLSDPRRLSPEARAAIEASPALASLRDDLLRVDDEMTSLLRAPEVPDGLADRIVLRARYRRGHPWLGALAASLISAALLLPLRDAERYPSPTERAIAAHVAEQVGEWNDDAHITPAALRASVAGLGVDVSPGGLRIRHLGNCVIEGRVGRHFVVDTAKGLVAFVILPAREEADAPRMAITAGGVRGLVMKRAGYAIGAFAHGGMQSNDLEALMRKVIT